MPTRGKDAVFAEEMQQLVSHSVQQLLVPLRKEIIDGQKAESAKIVREVNDLGTTVSDLKTTVSDLSSTFETRMTNTNLLKNSPELICMKRHRATLCIAYSL